MKTLSFACLVLLACGCQRAAQQNPETEHLPYSPGEYVSKTTSTAGATEDDLVLAVKAVDRKDLESLRTLKEEGVTFNLPKGTRIVLLPADLGLPTSVTGNIDGMAICHGKVESGKYIGTDVAVLCDSLTTP